MHGCTASAQTTLRVPPMCPDRSSFRNSDVQLRQLVPFLLGSPMGQSLTGMGDKHVWIPHS